MFRKGVKVKLSGPTIVWHCSLCEEVCPPATACVSLFNRLEFWCVLRIGLKSHGANIWTIRAKGRIGDIACTEMRFILCTWFGEFCSCCSLTALPGFAWVLLNWICKELISSLYIYLIFNDSLITLFMCTLLLTPSQILVHITKPWKTFRNVQPPNYILQNILQYRFDQGGRRDSDVLIYGSRERNIAIQVRVGAFHGWPAMVNC